MKKKKPTGFVAFCQCGACVGAMDAKRTDTADMGRILGAWLADGCTVTPRFGSDWSAVLTNCECEAQPPTCGD